MADFDVDIDVRPHTKKEDYGVRAMIFNEERQDVQPHPSGFYINTTIPVDKMTGFAAIPYKEAAEKGFVKVDLLTNTAYSQFNNKQEVLDCLHREPDWGKLLDEEFIQNLPHVANHGEVLREVQPRSMLELAEVLALIRPGKLHLYDVYLEDKEKARKNLWRKPKEGVYFKKSHALAYAAMIVCVMNKMDGGGLLEF